MFLIRRQGNSLGMLGIDNVGVIKGALDEICENVRAAISNSTCEKLRQKVNYLT